MSTFYIDSRALVKQYIEEPGSDVVVAIFDELESVCYVSLVGGAEVVDEVSADEDAEPVTMVSAGDDLNAAEAEGLAILNPLTPPEVAT